jgi:hypothetical protein
MNININKQVTLISHSTREQLLNIRSGLSKKYPRQLSVRPSPGRDLFAEVICLGLDINLFDPRLVIIEEVEAALTPSKQQEAVKVLLHLCKEHEDIKFILTTNSLTILNAFPDSETYYIDDLDFISGPNQLYGKDPKDILTDFFGLFARPKEIEDKFNEIDLLIAREDIPQARIKVAELEGIVGPHDFAILKTKGLLQFMEFLC